MNCKHCGKEIKPCWLGHNSNFCFGWLHMSNYHDCEDGLHKAEPMAQSGAGGERQTTDCIKDFGSYQVGRVHGNKED